MTTTTDPAALAQEAARRLADALAIPGPDYREHRYGTIAEARKVVADPSRLAAARDRGPALVTYDANPNRAAHKAASLARLARPWAARYLAPAPGTPAPQSSPQEARARRLADAERMPAPVPAHQRTRTQRGAPVLADPDAAPALPPEHPHWQQ